MPYPDKVLTDGEEVVAALHPHALTMFWPVARLLLVVGAASFGMAMVPVGPDQGVYRLAVLGLAVLLLLWGVLRPVLRRRSTHYVITTHRLLHRTGVLARSGRDLALARITDVSFTQTLGERVLRSGTLRVTSAGEGALEWDRVPRAERVQTLLNHMIEEDAERRAQESAGHLGEESRRGQATGGWGAGGWDAGTWGAPDTGGRGAEGRGAQGRGAEGRGATAPGPGGGGAGGSPTGWGGGGAPGPGPGYVTEWGTTEHRTTAFHTDPVR